MAFVHNVEIVWDELINAFTSCQSDRIYFLDCASGEIFAVPSALEDEEFWGQIEKSGDRFLEIPGFDYTGERRMVADFVNSVQDEELKRILKLAICGQKPFGNLDDIVSFFPEEHERLQEIRSEFLSSRVRLWLQSNDLFTMETEMLLSTRL